MICMKKKGVVWDTLIPWLIGIIVLVFMLMLYLTLSGKGIALLEFFRDAVRFR